MAANNLVYPITSIRSSVTSLKKKVTALRTSVENLNNELDNIEGKFDRLVSESEIFKAKLERETGREVRRLEKELENLRKQLESNVPSEPPTPEEDLKVASTLAIIESLLRAICDGADDFRLLSYSFLFPAVIDRVVKGDEEAYFLEEIPTSMDVVVRRGREYVAWIREECDTHLTDPESWNRFSPQICDWWRNDALPLLYGCRDENWDIDEPFSLAEMEDWRNNPAERPMRFPGIFDAYEVYRRHKDEVYKSSGVHDFDLKNFSFSSNAEL